MQNYPQEIQDLSCCMEQTGDEVDVHYEGQRGEGVYPVAFEGIDQECGTDDTGRRSSEIIKAGI